MEDELTEKMHSEFTIDAETEIKHRVYSVLSLVKYDDKKNLKKYAKMYDVTLEDVDKHKDEFYRLRNK